MAGDVNIKAVVSAEDRASSTLSNVGNSIGKLSASVAAGMAIYNLAGSVFQKFTNVLHTSISEAQGEELATTRLNTAIQNVTSATDKHIGGLISQAEALQKVTRFSDDQVISAQGILATFQQNQTVIATLTPRLLDMSEGLAQASGGMRDLEGSAMLVAKALGGEGSAGLITTLRRAGVQLTDLQTNILQNGDYQQRLAGITQALDANFKGLAQAAGTTTAGQMAILSNAIKDVKERFGNIVDSLLREVGPAITDFITKNGNMIISIVTAGAAVAGFALTIVAAAKIISFFTTVGLGPLGLALTAIAILIGVVVYKAMGNLEQKTQDTSMALKAAGDGLGNTIPQGTAKATKALADMTDQLAKVDKQIGQNNRDFAQQMAALIQTHQTKVATLKSQITDEKASFTDAQTTQTQTFQDSQEQQTRDHAARAAKIQEQLDKELQNRAWANQETLASLQAELDKENADYNAHFQETADKYAKDTAKAKEEHDKKITDLQTQLDQENALLQKHSTDVAAIRQADYIDEIDKLKQSHADQLASFAQQKEDIRKSVNDTTGIITSAYGGIPATLNSLLGGSGGPMSTLGSQLGNDMANGLKDALKSGLLDVGKGTVNWAVRASRFLKNSIDLNPADWLDSSKNPNTDKSLSEIWNDTSVNSPFSHRASGGPVSAGMPYTVGESGQETFVPSTNGTILPNGQSIGGTINISVNAGAYMGSQQDARRYAQMILNALKDIASARGTTAAEMLGG